MTKNLTRYLGDTYPEVFNIYVDDSLVYLEGWNVYFNLKEDQGGDVFKNIKITAVTNLLYKGLTKFFPRIEYSIDTSNANAPYVPFNVVGLHSYSITREKLYYYTNVLGTMVTLDGGETYISYDDQNVEHEGLTRYNPFTEVMTHYVGTVDVLEAP